MKISLWQIMYKQSFDNNGQKKKQNLLVASDKKLTFPVHATLALRELQLAFDERS